MNQKKGWKYKNTAQKKDEENVEKLSFPIFCILLAVKKRVKSFCGKLRAFNLLLCRHVDVEWHQWKHDGIMKRNENKK